jgi:hypothetical protein
LSALSGASKAAYYASACVDTNDNIHVVWGEDDGVISWGYEQLHYRYWNGSIWSTDVTLTSGAHYHYLNTLEVDSGNNLHLAFYEGSAPNAIRYLKKPSGSAWNAQATICEDAGYNQRWPSLKVDKDDNIHVAWNGYYNGGGAYLQIRYTKSTNGGTSWDTVQNLTSDAYDNGDWNNPISLACEPSTGYPHIVWCAPSYSSHKQIRFIEWTGSAWSSITEITADTTYDQALPGISFDKDGSTYVFWNGRHSESTTLNQIRSKKYSGSWGAIVNETNSNDTHQKFPIPIFARWRIDGTKVVNTPQTGYAFIWAKGVTFLRVNFSSDLAWETEGGGGNPHYAYAQQ